MNAFPALENSHLLVLQAVENLPESDWDVPGAAGTLSVKETVAHLVIYERLIRDALQTFSGQQPAPELARWAADPERFDLAELETLRYATAQQIEDEYQDLQVETNSLLALLSAEQVQKRGTLPWYKAQASLADFLNLMISHIQKHCEQILTFRENGVSHLA